MGEREFSADSEYRIRFFIAFSVLELLNDLWTSFLPFWAVLTKNANFMDEYLENGASFWRAVFFCWSVSFSSTFWEKMSKIVRVVFEKKPKNRYFEHFFVLYGWTKIFSKKTASSVFINYQCVTPCQISERSLERLPGKSCNQPTTTVTCFALAQRQCYILQHMIQMTL